MDFYANEGKAVTIQANGKTYARHAITTHFVQVGENYIDLLERYVIPVYQPGDILSASEKVIALCQGRVVTEEQVKPGFWAKLLSRFVHQTAAGPRNTKSLSSVHPLMPPAIRPFLKCFCANR